MSDRDIEHARLSDEKIDALEAASRTATPGPWEAVLEDDPRGQPVVYYRAIIGLLANAQEGGHLSVVASDERRVERAELASNAVLIAAAPCLLAEVLRQRAEARADVWREVLSIVQAHSVSLARLEAHCAVIATFPGRVPHADACLLALRDVLRAAKAGAKGGGDG